MHCFDLNCSQCKHDAVVGIFGQQFFQQDEDAHLLWMLQQEGVDADAVAQYLETHPKLVLQPHHFCALCKHGSRLGALTNVFIQKVLEARAHTRSLVRAGIQYSVALQMWHNVPAHVDMWLAKPKVLPFPTQHWCCEHHKKEAFAAIKTHMAAHLFKAKDVSLCLPHALHTVQLPLGHPLPA